MSCVMAITPTRHRSRLTSQGQITVPKRVREAMRLQPGDEVEFELGSPITVRRRRPRGLLSFAGIAGKATSRIPATAEEIDAAIARAWGRSGDG